MLQGYLNKDDGGEEQASKVGEPRFLKGDRGYRSAREDYVPLVAEFLVRIARRAARNGLERSSSCCRDRSCLLDIPLSSTGRRIPILVDTIRCPE